MSLTSASPCDNVLLEFRFALVLRAMGMLDYVLLPVFVGDSVDVGARLGMSRRAATVIKQFLTPDSILQVDQQCVLKVLKESFSHT